MPYNHLSTDLHQELHALTPQLQAHFAALSADSHQLHHLLDYPDQGEAVALLTTLGEALIRHVSHEDVTTHVDAARRADQLARHFRRMGEGIVYQQAVAAQLNLL